MITLKKCFTLLFLGVLFSIQNVNASHIVGGVMTYECNGKGDYDFVIKMYRDCNGGGAAFDSTPNAFTKGTVTIFRGKTQIQILELNAPAITKINGGLDNPCIVFPPNICVEEGIYRFSYFLPKSTESYTIAYQRCCRNNSINNIVSPRSSGSTFSIEILPVAYDLCNSTPVFNKFPPILICANSPLVFDHAATDADGDQLVYEMCAPFLGGGLDGSGQGSGGSASSYTGVAPNPDSPPDYREVRYLVPTYSAGKPMAGNPVVKINSNTGEITGTPTIEGQFVVGICVSEYRNGVLLSKVRRDFQFNVANCDPVVKSDIKEDEKIGPKEFVINSCGNNTVLFINESYQRNYIKDHKWEFIVNGDIKTFSTWDAEVTFPSIGTYNGSLFLNPGLDCADTASIFVNIYPEIRADFDYDYDTCVSGPVDLFDKSFSGSGPITQWEWDFSDGDFSNDKNTQHQFDTPGTKNVALTVVDRNKCVDKKIIPLYWVPAPKEIIIDPSTINGCAPEDVFFDNLSTPIDDTYDIVWDFGDGTTGSDISPYHTYENAGVYSISLHITSPIGCFISKDYNNLVKIRPSPQAGFMYTPKKLSSFQKDASFFDESIDAVSWEWQFGDDFKSFERNPTYSFADTGFYKVTQIVTHQYGCTDTLFRILDVDPLVNYFLPNAFSPNNDATNEFFKGRGKFKGMKDFSMVIFNRWGETIFESTDPEIGWNGRKFNSGGMSPPGVYVFVVSYSDARNRYFEFKGFSTLVL